MKSAFALSLLMLSLSPLAQAAEAVAMISPTEWEDAKVNVAQIVENDSISGVGTTAQLTGVYRGGIAAPFGAFLSIWDPIPQNGSDFGTVTTFDLGNFGAVPSVSEQRVILERKDEWSIEIKLNALIPNDDATTLELMELVATVKIKKGVVTGPLMLKRVALN